jgi:hypothetical protein
LRDGRWGEKSEFFGLKYFTKASLLKPIQMNAKYFNHRKKQRKKEGGNYKPSITQNT